MLIFQFESKNPHNTYWLQAYYEQGDEAKLEEFEKAASTIGWYPYNKHPDAGFRFVPAETHFRQVFHGMDNKFASLEFDGPRGSGIFNLWTDAERTRFARQMRALCKQFSNYKVLHRKLTLEDLL